MKHYEKIKVGQEIFPVRDLYKSFPEYKNCRFFIAAEPRSANFPQPLTLKVKKGKEYLRKTQRWSGHWFTEKKGRNIKDVH